MGRRAREGAHSAALRPYLWGVERLVPGRLHLLKMVRDGALRGEPRHAGDVIQLGMARLNRLQDRARRRQMPHTPRNPDVDAALQGFGALASWCSSVSQYFTTILFPNSWLLVWK